MNREAPTQRDFKELKTQEAQNSIRRIHFSIFHNLFHNLYYHVEIYWNDAVLPLSGLQESSEWSWVLVQSQSLLWAAPLAIRVFVQGSTTPGPLVCEPCKLKGFLELVFPLSNFLFFLLLLLSLSSFSPLSLPLSLCPSSSSLSLKYITKCVTKICYENQSLSFCPHKFNPPRHPLLHKPYYAQGPHSWMAIPVSC